MSPAGSHPDHWCSPSPGSCTGLLETSPPSAAALHQSPKCCPTNGPTKPHVPSTYLEPTAERAPGLPCQGSFPECPLLPQAQEHCSGLSPGRLQSAQQEIVLQTPTHCLLPAALVLSPERGGPCVWWLLACPSVCQTLITWLRAEPAWLPELWGRAVNRRDTALPLSQFAALGSCQPGLFHGRNTSKQL